MTDQLILGIGVALVALLIAYEAVETWRWRGFDNRPPSRFGVIRFVRGAIGGVVSIVTLRRWRTRGAAPAPTLSTGDVAQQLGEPPSGPLHLQPGRIVVSGAPLVSRQLIQPVRPSQQPGPGPSRIRLVRDTIGAALIMGGFVVVFANLMPVRPQGDVEGEAATPRVVIVSPPPPSPSPGSIATATPGDPTATPTPALVSSTPSPTPSPISAAGPTARAQPTDPPALPPTANPRTTPKPAPKPTKTPAPTPAPTPTPVISSFTSSAANGHALPFEAVTFAFTCQDATTFMIDYSDGSMDPPGDASSGEGSSEHAFAPGSYTVVLTVYDAGGASDVASLSITVP